MFILHSLMCFSKLRLVVIPTRIINNIEINHYRHYEQIYEASTKYIVTNNKDNETYNIHTRKNCCTGATFK